MVKIPMLVIWVVKPQGEDGPGLFPGHAVIHLYVSLHGVTTLKANTEEYRFNFSLQRLLCS